MPQIKVPAFFGSLSFSTLLLAAHLIMMASAHTLLAQTTPAAGTSVVIKMIDAVDSGTDPAGKQYHASLTKAVDAGNGVTIPQGAAATVTLASSASGWTAQLASVTINGQAVAVTSSSASVTTAAQNAAGSAASTVGSALGRFGVPRNVPPSVTAVATGQRVVLPPGTTLTFVLGTTAPPNAPPAAANVTPAATPATPAACAAAAAPRVPAAATRSGNKGPGPNAGPGVRTEPI